MTNSNVALSICKMLNSLCWVGSKELQEELCLWDLDFLLPPSCYSLWGPMKSSLGLADLPEYYRIWHRHCSWNQDSFVTQGCLLLMYARGWIQPIVFASQACYKGRSQHN